MFPAANVDWVWTMERNLPSDKDIGHAAIDELVQALEQSGWDGRELFHVQMAVQEAVDNAIDHGNKGDPSKHIRLDFRVSPVVCYIQITDEGPGFLRAMVNDCTDAKFVDKPRGRGVLLIEKLMSEASYNEKGNQLTMIRKRNDPKLAIAEE